MMVKTSLHIHTFEDKVEGYMIKYNIYDLIDWAGQLGFKVLGLTCHKKFIYQDDYAVYAAKKGILLLFGIELQMKKRAKRNDLIILNINPKDAAAVEKINSFEKLAEFREEHQEIFVLAPHPLAARLFSMGKKKLIRNMHLFDGVEHCWCYSRRFLNFNKKTKKITEKFNKPFMATSDAHFLRYFNTDYILVESDKLEPASIFAAIKQGAFTNVTRPKKIHQIFWCLANLQLKKYIFFIFKFKQVIRHKRG
ncbi:MAG: PHP-associated domain-containing protein [Patescibacteria group bacterium]|nr:PHP-associated domain-containing protein [Patescibacteria group bacterium]